MKLIADYRKQYKENPRLIILMLLISLASIVVLFWLYGDSILYFIFESGKLIVKKILRIIVVFLRKFLIFKKNRINR